MPETRKDIWISNKKKTVNSQDIAITNILASNNRASKYRKQKLTELKREIDKPIIIVGGFNSPLSETDRLTRQKESENTDLENTVNQHHLTDIYSTIHTANAKQTHSFKVHMEFQQDVSFGDHKRTQ